MRSKQKPEPPKGPHNHSATDCFHVDCKQKRIEANGVGRISICGVDGSSPDHIANNGAEVHDAGLGDGCQQAFQPGASTTGSLPLGVANYDVPVFIEPRGHRQSLIQDVEKQLDLSKWSPGPIAGVDDPIAVTLQRSCL